MSSPAAEPLYWSAARAETLRLERLHDSLRRARQAEYYRDRLPDEPPTSLDDLRRWPLLTKEALRAASPFGLVAVPREDLFQYHESFGTTGVPAASWLTEYDLNAYAAQINQSAIDFRRGDRVLVRFPYAISVPAHIVTQAARQRGACVVPCSSRSTISPYPRVIELLRKLEVTVLACLPTEAIWLAEAAAQMGLDSQRDFPHLRGLCVAGELLTDARRARISALWNAQVVNHYGCTEAGNIATDCPQGKLHLAWDHFVLETLDFANAEPAPLGQVGSAVLTTLTRQAMPLVRFVLGDAMRLLPGESCGCGRQAPVIEHLGRDLNQFQFQGRIIRVSELERILLAAPAAAIGNLWLIEIRGPQAIFRCEAAAPDSALYAALQNQILSELQLPLEIVPVPPGSLMNRARLMHVEPVNKPRIVAELPVDAPAATLDSLCRGG